MPDYNQPLRFGAFIQWSPDDLDAMVAEALLTDLLGFDFLGIRGTSPDDSELASLIAAAYFTGVTRRITPLVEIGGHSARSCASTPTAVSTLAALAGRHLAVVFDSTGDDSDGGQRVAGSASGAAAERSHRYTTWLTGAGPDVVDEVARTADGWLAAPPFVPLGTLRDHQKRLDAAAVAVGRDPSGITRGYCVSGEFTAGHPRVDGLLRGDGRVLDHRAHQAGSPVRGVGVHADADQDRREQLHVFAREVAPAVNQAVAEFRRQRSLQAAPIPVP